MKLSGSSGKTSMGWILWRWKQLKGCNTSTSRILISCSVLMIRKDIIWSHQKTSVCMKNPSFSLSCHWTMYPTFSCTQIPVRSLTLNREYFPTLPSLQAVNHLAWYYLSGKAGWTEGRNSVPENWEEIPEVYCAKNYPQGRRPDYRITKWAADYSWPASWTFGQTDRYSQCGILALYA